MAIESPFSKHRRNTFVMWMGVCIVFAVVFAYDGYLSKYEWSQRYSFYKKHCIDNGGKPDGTLSFNRKAPPFLIGIAAVLGGWLFVQAKRRIFVDENNLVIDDKETIACDSIQRIDKTNFESRGYFVVTYKNTAGAEVNRRISDASYDNLGPVLDHLVTKIS